LETGITSTRSSPGIFMHYDVATRRGATMCKKETAMDRRLFLTGLVGVGTATAVACVLPRQAEALVTVPPGDPLPPYPDGLPDVTAPGLDLDATAPELEGDDGDIEYVSHRRRRRVRRWRRRCRRHWYHGHWRRRCRRVPFWAWIWISI
jgi:hypothetical protein